MNNNMNKKSLKKIKQSQAYRYATASNAILDS